MSFAMAIRIQLLKRTSTLLLPLVLFMSLPCNIYTACGKGVVTRNATSAKTAYLYPLTESKVNQSHIMPIILKEIAYRSIYLQRNATVSDTVITYDFCNDLSKLIEILFQLTLDISTIFRDVLVVIHASLKHVKMAGSVLSFFEIADFLFIDNFDTNSVYYGDAIYDINSGFVSTVKLESKNHLLERTFQFYRIFINLCYLKEYQCQCLLFQMVTESSKNLGHFYLSEWSDLQVILEQVLEKIPDNKNLKINLSAISDIDFKYIRNTLEEEHGRYFIE